MGELAPACGLTAGWATKGGMKVTYGIVTISAAKGFT